ncbi:MAG: CopD family protein [Rhodanobacteraceae bacterium]|nr:CopD family protein [Rhodanobacteraceae bacterium]
MSLVLLLHLLGATVWTGGHLVLALAILPQALRERRIDELLQFERRYERLGLPALLLQVATGIALAHAHLPDPWHWFDPSQPLARPIGLKLLLLALLLPVAVHARLRLIPRLSVATLPWLAAHIVFVTVLSVGFVVIGVSFRTGWLY